MNRSLKLLIFAVLIFLVALFFYRKYKVAPAVNFDKLILSDLSGQAVKLRDYKGKKLVVSFGASWCGNCREELNMIKKIKDQSLQGIEVVVISDEEIERIEAFSKNYPFTFLKMDQQFGAIGVNAVPTTYIINTKFEVKEETVGYIDWEDPSTVEHLKQLME